MNTWYVHRRVNSWMKNQKRSKSKLNCTRTVFWVKTLLQCSKCSKLKLIGKSNNCGHLHYSCKNTGESFFDRHAVKRRLNLLKNYFLQEPLSRALENLEIRMGLVGTALDFVFFPLHWSGTTRRHISNEITENEWHLLLLFHRRPLIVGLNRLVRLVSRYGLDLPRLAILVGEHCDRL